MCGTFRGLRLSDDEPVVPGRQPLAEKRQSGAPVTPGTGHWSSNPHDPGDCAGLDQFTNLDLGPTGSALSVVPYASKNVSKSVAARQNVELTVKYLEQAGAGTCYLKGLPLIGRGAAELFFRDVPYIDPNLAKE